MVDLTITGATMAAPNTAMTTNTAAGSGGNTASGASGDNNNHSVVRPTEAQLRWAQFHHKRRAHQVRQAIDRLYRTPLEFEAKEVDTNDDDVSDPNDNDDSSKSAGTDGSDTTLIRDIRRRRRPAISDGRRDLLKHSRRRYRRRKRSILEHGYREGFVGDDDGGGCGGGDLVDGEETDETKQDRAAVATTKSSKGWSKSRHARQKNENDVDGNVDTDADESGYDDDDDDHDDNDDALDEIFMSRPKRQRQRRHKTEQDKESFKRFQAACHAMMMNVKTASAAAKGPAVVQPTSKRWTRSEQHIAAAASMNQDYLDFKWGIRRKEKQNALRTTSSFLSAYFSDNMAPMDRGATWLMHASKHVSYNRDTPYYHDVAQLPPGSVSSAGGSEGNLSSSTLAMRTPGPKKFHQLVNFVQQRLIEKERLRREDLETRSLEESTDRHSVPTMRLRHSRLEDGTTDDGASANSNSKARALAESFEKKSKGGASESAGRIRQMAKSLEGNQTPTMKVQNELEFMSSGSKQQGSSRRRRSRYVPRMRLREFTTPGGESNNANDGDDTALKTPRMRLAESFQNVATDAKGKEIVFTGPPKMRLRDFNVDLGDKKEEEFEGRRTSEARESALEQEQSKQGGRIKQMAQSLKPGGAPRMKLRDLPDELEENLVSEPSVLGTPTMRLADSPAANKDQKLTGQAAKTSGSARVSEYYAQARPMNDDPVTQEPDLLDVQEEGSPDNPSRKAQPLNELAVKAPSSPKQFTPTGATSLASSKSVKPLPVQQSKSSSPGKLSDAMSDHSERSNLSNLSDLWKNRKRGSSLLANAFSSGLNAITESSGEGNNSIDTFLSPAMKERASNVSGKVGGMINKLRGKEDDKKEEGVEKQAHVSEKNQGRQAEEHAEEAVPVAQHDILHVPSEDSHEALAAYRKNRASMSPDLDATSSASSFAPLPAEIRKAVQKSNPRSPPRTKATHEKDVQPPAGFAPPNRSVVTQSTNSELSTGKMKKVQDKVLQSSALLADFDRDSVIDTDDTQSDASPSGGMNPQMLAGLMMSPDVLQKRLGQAIRAVEQQKWDQVVYLINANPWLAEMKELTTNQYLLHKLAFFGGGDNPAPNNLAEGLVEKFPAAVYKFDQDGNVPLHLAAASRNLPMIKMLGEKFESGASIRNEDGMLPLHFTIAAYSDVNGRDANEDEFVQDSLRVLKTVLGFFPKAVAIADNDGNLPLHVAAECLEGALGVDVVYLLMDEADRQMEDPEGARFRNKLKIEGIMNDEMSIGTVSTERETDSSVLDTEVYCNMVVNEHNETPLLVAIHARKGWHMIEAILSGNGGRKASLHQDADKNNALHLLVGEYQDATAAMSILKVAPESATVQNALGVLPIEVACMHFLPEEVILSIALIDLPINIDDKDGIKVHESQGASWCYLACESDDHFVNIVQEIVSICSFFQLRELCFMKDSSGSTVIARASPKCREVLNQALRFMGRFELVGNGPIVADAASGRAVFEALDFGEESYEWGKRVLLECFENEEAFEARVRIDRSLGLARAFHTLCPHYVYVVLCR